MTIEICEQETKEMENEYSMNDDRRVLTDDDDKDKKEKTKEIIILIFPDGRKDEE